MLSIDAERMICYSTTVYCLLSRRLLNLLFDALFLLLLASCFFVLHCCIVGLLVGVKESSMTTFYVLAGNMKAKKLKTHTQFFDNKL